MLLKHFDLCSVFSIYSPSCPRFQSYSVSAALTLCFQAQTVPALHFSTCSWITLHNCISFTQSGASTLFRISGFRHESLFEEKIPVQCLCMITASVSLLLSLELCNVLLCYRSCICSHHIILSCRSSQLPPITSFHSLLFSYWSFFLVKIPSNGQFCRAEKSGIDVNKYF